MLMSTETVLAAPFIGEHRVFSLYINYCWWSS